MKTLMLISGPVAGGKSSIARILIKDHAFGRVGTGDYLRDLALAKGIETSRSSLQQLGDALDSESDYLWLIKDVAIPMINAQAQVDRWLLDSVRKHRQVEHFRSQFRDAVTHVHIEASEAMLKARYDARLAAGGEYEGNTAYEIAIRHPNEVSARSLKAIADLVIDTTATTPAHAVQLILEYSKGASN